MKKIFCILSVLTIASPVFAAGEPTIYESTAASAKYVQGAYNALDSAKQAKLNTGTNVTQGDGSVVTGVSASDGAVTVTRSYRTTIPVDGPETSSRASMWVQ